MTGAAAVRGDRRDIVMRCAREAIAADGIGNVRLEDIAVRAGMSIGHVMYYFKTRDRLVLETLCWSELNDLALLKEELERLRSPMRRATRFVERYLPQQPRDPGWGMWFQLLTSSQEPLAEIEELEAALAAWKDLFIDIVVEGLATGAFHADPDDLAEWYMPYLEGLAVEMVTVGQSARTAATAARAVRRLKKELTGATPAD